MGEAVVHITRVHSHPRVAKSPPGAIPTGIDYLGIVEARHAAELARPISYGKLNEPSGWKGDLDTPQPISHSSTCSEPAIEPALFGIEENR